jgi:hypothetical protein
MEKKINNWIKTFFLPSIRLDGSDFRVGQRGISPGKQEKYHKLPLFSVNATLSRLVKIVGSCRVAFVL